MAEKSVIKKQNVAGGGTDNHDFAPIGDGKIWTIRKFGALDVNNGDNKSSVYLLRWGSTGSFDEVRAIALSGSTYEFDINKQFTGDGTKFFRVVRMNTSSTAKDLVFWIDANQRN